MIRAVRRPRRKYYGWTIVWTLAVTETVSWGILYYAFAVFLVPMQTELGWSTPQITGAYSLALVVTMLLSPPLGHWFDRSDTRVPMTLGSILGTAFLVAWSRVESLAGFYLIWAGIGVALALPLRTRVRRSLDLVRARPIPSAADIDDCGGTRQHDISSGCGVADRAPRLADALLVLAIILGVTTIPGHALVLRRRPEDLGLLPDGELAEPGQASPPPQGVTLSRALRDPAYWWLNCAFFLGMAAAVAIGVYLIPVLLERGESLARATFITGLIGAAQVGGRVAITALGRRVPEQALGATVFALLAVALAVILITSGLALTLLAVALLGAGRGGVTLMRATLVADRYGRANFAAISGIPAAAQMAARAVAPVGAGLLITWLGGYTSMLAVLVGIAIAATLAMVMFALSARPLRLAVPAPDVSEVGSR